VTASVVILSHRPADLRELLACLRRQTLPPAEIVLIDTSEAGTLGRLAAEALAGRGIRLAWRHRPDLGTARGRNLGIELASGELIALLDDDMLVADDYLETGARFLTCPGHEQVAAITLLGPYGDAPRATPAGLRSRVRLLVKCLFLLDSRRPGVVLPTGFRSELPAHTARVGWVQGGNSIWRAPVLKRFRLDEELERYRYALSEDIALAVRVAREHELHAVQGSGAQHKKSPGQRLTQREYGESLVRNHRHIARLVARSSRTPAVFYWGCVGLALHGLALLAVRRDGSGVAYLRGLADGLLDRGGSRPVGVAGAPRVAGGPGD
jgi:glycosyltransferase involved in cell wall biosynthesis